MASQCSLKKSHIIANAKKVKCFKLTTFFYGAFCIPLFLLIATSCTDRDLSFYLEKITHNLSVPTNLNAIPADGQVQLSWDVKADLAYYVYWSTNSGVDINNGTKIENVTSPFKHTKLTNDRMYYYIIIANNGFTMSPPTHEIPAMPSKTPSPTGLTAVAGDAQVTLSWNVANGTTYTLYWSTTSGVNTANGTPIANVTSPHTHMGLINGDTYYYVLTATNRFGVSLPSPEISAIPMQTPTPTPTPMGLTAVAGDAQVTLSWNVANGTTYTLYWSTTSGVNTANGTPIANVTSPHTHMGLTNGTAYYYVLTATNSFGISPPTAEVMATPMQTPVQTTPSPTGLMATAGISRVEISWTVVMGTTYDLYWSTTQRTGINGTPIPNATSPYTHTGAGVSNGNTYFYVLTATNSFGISPPTAEVMATPMQTVAIWTLGAKQGNFGFTACQTALDATASNSIGAELRRLGYRKAVFFGSMGGMGGMGTTTSYDFKDIVTNTAGLGLSSTGSYPLRLFKLNSTGNTMEVEDVTPSGSTTTIRAIVNPSNGNVSRKTVFGSIGVSDRMLVCPSPRTCFVAWWTFTRPTLSLSSCNNAMSSSGTDEGVTSSVEDIITAKASCSEMLHVVCVAK